MLQKMAAALRARLIEDARHAWRYASIWIAGSGAVLIGAWNELPAEVREALPAPIAHAVPTLFLVAVIVGRLVKQEDAGGR